MSPTNYALAVKKRTNLSINESLLSEAKKLGINISSSAEAGIQKALLERKQALWLQENQEAIDSSNDFVANNGLPFDKFRNF
ncbi:type II toxin-antitoxin system CcdA family antitoxin [Paraglaciecola aquimarina]|uniref:Type II toxin-antitoxin system CcdA family antitoxin n=1 Tax=Paraglaciecola algarum TaxID=3050085 RepID=A0ABS9D5D3_9ALTE|nr:type II toxin-antitoxin system CcdA family antitoxin [Paraglaciecola sp. G1-23]MCF2947980.1 type II toxin-antitoxin system CcdA family antitoxin [Paraglaciecola sp. G1-23]